MARNVPRDLYLPPKQRALSMNVSDLGSSKALHDLFATAQKSTAASSSPDTTNFTDTISLTNDADNIVQNDTTNATIGTSVNYLFYQLNAGILAPSGNFAGVDSAIDTYTQSLPTSNV